MLGLGVAIGVGLIAFVLSSLLSLSIPTDICHSCIGYRTVVSEMTLLFTRGILTKFVCLAPSHDNELKGS